MTVHRMIFWAHNHPNPLVADLVHFGQVSEDRLRAGRRIRTWRGELWLKASDPQQDGTPDDVLQSSLGCVPIFSPRLVSLALREGLQGVQFLPVKVFTSAGDPIEGFSIANVLAVSGALDLKASTYSVFENDYFLPQRRGRICSLRGAVFRNEMVAQRDLFRAAEFRSSVFVSEKFKRLFERGGFTGAGFLPASYDIVAVAASDL